MQTRATIKLVLSLSLPLMLTFSSCGEYENIELQTTLIKRADSIYHNQKDSLIKLSDSICTKRFDHYYKDAFDSIKELQINSIENLMRQ